MSPIYREMATYLVASTVAFLLDIGLLAAQVSLLDISYLAAAAVAFLVGTLFLYWASVTHIFGYRKLTDPNQELGIFLGIGVVGLGVNLITMYGLVDGLDLHYLLAKVFAAALTFGVNFGLRRAMLFSRWRGKPHSARLRS